jgi:hypothetical protein
MSILSKSAPGRRKSMKGVIALPLAAALAIGLAGCGAGHPTSQPSATVTVTASPQATAATSPAASSVSASTNERLFADAMAESIPVTPAGVVAGALMRAYVRFEHAYGAAWGAVGQPILSSSVAQVAGGFKLCYTSSSGSGCQRYTQFTTNHAGQIIDVSVKGQPVAGRIATAPAATSDGLTISSVVALRFADAPDLVGVAFKLTDTDYRPVNTSPSLLASFGGASPDENNDALPATLGPGDSLYAGAAFDITQVTGLLCLQPNDGFGEHLPCTTLRKV